MTKINTARSVNTQDWKGFTIYVTRTPQRHKKYKADKWMKYFGNSYKKLGNYQRWLNRDTMYKSEWHIRGILLGMICKHKEVTLICFCEDVNKCHRKILAEWLCKNFKEFELGEIR